MIELEDQIHRYATDVAGPALADPPGDLAEVGGRQANRGRWMLVAALVLFVAGLATTALLSGRGDGGEATPFATERDLAIGDDLPDPPPDALAWAAEHAPCSTDHPEVGVHLAGPLGDGICLSASWVEPDSSPPIDGMPNRYEVLMVNWFLNGEFLAGGSVAQCETPPFDGMAQPGSDASQDGVIIVAEVPDNVATGRTNDGMGSTIAAFEVPGVDGARFLASRMPVELAMKHIQIFDADGRLVSLDPLPDLVSSSRCDPTVRPIGKS